MKRRCLVENTIEVLSIQGNRRPEGVISVREHTEHAARQNGYSLCGLCYTVFPLHSNWAQEHCPPVLETKQLLLQTQLHQPSGIYNVFRFGLSLILAAECPVYCPIRSSADALHLLRDQAAGTRQGLIEGERGQVVCFVQ